MTLLEILASTAIALVAAKVIGYLARRRVQKYNEKQLEPYFDDCSVCKKRFNSYNTGSVTSLGEPLCDRCDDPVEIVDEALSFDLD